MTLSDLMFLIAYSLLTISATLLVWAVPLQFACTSCEGYIPEKVIERFVVIAAVLAFIVQFIALGGKLHLYGEY